MDITISTITEAADGIFKIADHRECDASIRGQVLPQAKGCGYQALIALLDFLQLRVLRPITIDSRCQAFDAMDVKIQLDKTKCGEIGEERLFGNGQESRKFREWHRLVPAPEVESGAPRANDLSEDAICGKWGWQLGLATAVLLRLAGRRNLDVAMDLCSSMDFLNPGIRYLLIRKPIGLTTK